MPRSLRTLSTRRALTLVGLPLVAVSILSACTSPSAAEPSAAPVVAADSSNVLELPRLSSDAALAAATAALESCRTEGVGFVSVAVVDRFGQVQALVRGDGAAAHTLDAATRKGYTSAAFGTTTSVLAERAADGSALRDLDGTLFLAGGVPVKAGEATIAGIGVGGAPDGAVDEGCAAVGAAVLEAAVAN